ncbi:MAG: RDD family protein [Bdellovibrionaceae bacterium]|nr:RDD family protein [Pseudobdellovibrionaceae bacterium]
MGTDPFEEFEFKPLTEGLGFHQTKNQNPVVPPPAAKTPAPTSNNLNSRGIGFSEEETVNPLKSPLPRRELKNPGVSAADMSALTTPSASAVDDILNTLHQNRKMEIEMDRRHRQELRNPKKTETWKPSAPKFSPMLLDGMLITAASLLCMIIMLIITRVDLIANLTKPDSEGFVYMATAALFAGVTFIYVVVHRAFLGFTPGEWAYDLRLGKPEEQNQGLFALKVVGRQVVLTVTGLFLLPLIGLVMGKDVAGALSGTQLMRKP